MYGRAVGGLAVALAVAASAPAPAGAGHAQRACHGVGDGVLCMELPRGWSKAICPGRVGGKAAAYLLAGNYRFQYRRCQEGEPDVPAGRILISIGDFPTVGRWAHLPRVRHLRLPRRAIASRVVGWQVRYAGRGIAVVVHFGSRPTAQSRALVNTRLASVRRVRS
jgi:hypothetical protein